MSAERNKTARYWRYDGNHHAGRNHERHDPHNFGLSLIVAMSYWGEDGDNPPAPLTWEDTQKIVVKHHKGDEFGHEVTVSAPDEVWLKGMEALANFWENNC